LSSNKDFISKFLFAKTLSFRFNSTSIDISLSSIILLNSDILLRINESNDSNLVKTVVKSEFCSFDIIESNSAISVFLENTEGSSDIYFFL
jgi:hypothetical protein